MTFDPFERIAELEQAVAERDAIIVTVSEDLNPRDSAEMRGRPSKPRMIS